MNDVNNVYSYVLKCLIIYQVKKEIICICTRWRDKIGKGFQTYNKKPWFSFTKKCPSFQYFNLQLDQINNSAKQMQNEKNSEITFLTHYFTTLLKPSNPTKSKIMDMNNTVSSTKHHHVINLSTITTCTLLDECWMLQCPKPFTGVTMNFITIHTTKRSHNKTSAISTL